MINLASCDRRPSALALAEAEADGAAAVVDKQSTPICRASPSVQQWGVVPAQLRDQLGQLRSERLEAADNIAQPVGLFLTDTTE